MECSCPAFCTLIVSNQSAVSMYHSKKRKSFLLFCSSLFQQLVFTLFWFTLIMQGHQVPVSNFQPSYFQQPIGSSCGPYGQRVHEPVHPVRGNLPMSHFHGDWKRCPSCGSGNLKRAYPLWAYICAILLPVIGCCILYNNPHYTCSHCFSEFD